MTWWLWLIVLTPPLGFAWGFASAAGHDLRYRLDPRGRVSRDQAVERWGAEAFSQAPPWKPWRVRAVIRHELSEDERLADAKARGEVHIRTSLGWR